MNTRSCVGGLESKIGVGTCRHLAIGQGGVRVAGAHGLPTIVDLLRLSLLGIVHMHLVCGV